MKKLYVSRIYKKGKLVGKIISDKELDSVNIVQKFIQLNTEDLEEYNSLISQKERLYVIKKFISDLQNEATKKLTELKPKKPDFNSESIEERIELGRRYKAEMSDYNKNIKPVILNVYKERVDNFIKENNYYKAYLFSSIKNITEYISIINKEIAEIDSAFNTNEYIIKSHIEYDLTR